MTSVALLLRSDPVCKQMGRYWVATVLMLCLVPDEVRGLECWKCMGDNCDLEPSSNDKAETTKCFDGQTCQKAYFEMLDELTNIHYISTVRGCASYCAPRNDFENCTYQQRTTRGCVRKNCCHDDDLCNRGSCLKMPHVILFALCVSSLFNSYSFILL